MAIGAGLYTTMLAVEIAIGSLANALLGSGILMAQDTVGDAFHRRRV